MIMRPVEALTTALDQDEDNIKSVGPSELHPVSVAIRQQLIPSLRWVCFKCKTLIKKYRWPRFALQCLRVALIHLAYQQLASTRPRMTLRRPSCIWSQPCVEAKVELDPPYVMPDSVPLPGREELRVPETALLAAFRDSIG